MSVSVAIIALNEEQNLPRTLASIAWADEIVVVDSGSTDRTGEIAKEHGARVVERQWAGFGAQKNLALSLCNSEWLLSLDADEEVSPLLAEEIRIATGLQATPAPDAYTVPRRNYFLGRPLRFGGMYPDRKLRLIRRELFVTGHARFAERPVHEDIAYAGEAGELRGDLLHHAYPTLAGYLEHLDRYSTLGAATVKPHGTLWFAAQTTLNPWLTFVYNYVVRGGFLDGRPGVLYHAYHSLYVSWKYARAWRLQREHGHPH